MKAFLDINKQKLPFAFKASSLTFTAFALVIFIYAYTQNEFPDVLVFVGVLLFTSLVLPTIIIGIAYLEWLSKRRIRNKAFSKQPLEDLDKIGFTVSYLNEQSKWYFTEETKEISINNYLIQCDIKNGSPNTVDFKAFVKHEPLEKERFKTLEAELKSQEIYYDFGGVVKKYNIKNTKNSTAEQLKNDLEQFVQTLEKEGFQPDEK